jgi:hypothetical protein
MKMSNNARIMKLGKLNFQNLPPIAVRVCSRDCPPYLKDRSSAAIQMSTLPALAIDLWLSPRHH